MTFMQRTTRAAIQSPVGFKLCDYVEFATMCAPEYNRPELSDRILVFDVMRDGWETASILESVPKTESDQTANLTVTLGNSNEKQLQTLAESKRGTGEEKPLHEVRLDVHSGSRNANESNDLQTKESKQNMKKTQNSEDDFVAAESEKPKSSDISNSFNRPIRQHKVYVHSFWLAVQSPYFRSLFYSSGMKENHEKEVHLAVSESEENAHLILLQAMYRNDVLNCKKTHEVLVVLELAFKYDLKFLFKKCKYILLKIASGTTLEICTQIMNLIKVKHNMSDVEDLATTLQQVLLREFCPLDEKWQSAKFTNLSEPSIKYLLGSDDLIVQSENTVFHALMYWMKENNIDPAAFEEKNDLLAVVRFELVTIDYLYNVIKNHPIASKMPKFNDLYFSGVTYQLLPSDQKKLLEKKPVLRRKPARNIIQYTFVVKQKSELTPKASTTTCTIKEVQTKEGKLLGKFWACGYQMSITAIENFSNVSLRLNVLNLNQESLVRLKFAIWGIDDQDIDIAWQEDVFTLSSNHKEHQISSLDEDLFSPDKKTFQVVAIPL